MEVNTLLDIFQEKRQEGKKKFIYYQKIVNKISMLRGISFVLLLVSFFLSFYKLFFLLIFLLFFALFLFLLVYFRKHYYQKKYYENYLLIIDKYLSKIKGDWSSYSLDTGLEFYEEEEEDFIQDLDIIGKCSLFQFLNIGRTYLGKKKLYQALTNPYLEEAALLEKQAAIQELSDDIDFCVDFQTNTMSMKQNYHTSNIAMDVTSKKIIPFLLLGGIFSFAFITICILSSLNKASWSYLIIPVVLQLVFFFIFYRTNIEILQKMESMDHFWLNLKESLSCFQNKKFNSPLLQKVTSNIIFANSDIKKLSVLSNWDSLRYGLLSAIVFNAIFPFSTLVIFFYQKRVKESLSRIMRGIDAFAEMESLISLATIGQVRTNITMPKRCEEITIAVEEIRHPLLNEEECIPNNFQTKYGINVITGSNMSGKTSFMRIIGINQILMNAGTFVMAKSYHSAYFKLFTSMRISDDLSKGISTFYAELLKIKKALEYQIENKNMLTLIDEVFRGTNSNDRIDGAITLLKKLNTKKSIVLITTHDFELCNIEIDTLKNYHFSEFYENNEIKFSYKLQNGRCKTTNAAFLMKLVGITEE